MGFKGLLISVGPRNHVLDEARYRTKHSLLGGVTRRDAASCQITLTCSILVVWFLPVFVYFSAQYLSKQRIIKRDMSVFILRSKGQGHESQTLAACVFVVF